MRYWSNDLFKGNYFQSGDPGRMFCNLDRGVPIRRRRVLAASPETVPGWYESNTFLDWLWLRSGRDKVGKPCENCGEGKAAFSGFCCGICEIEAYKKERRSGSFRKMGGCRRDSSEKTALIAEQKKSREFKATHPVLPRSDRHHSIEDGMQILEHTCHFCSGRGVVYEPSNRKKKCCDKCNGRGYREVAHKVRPVDHNLDSAIARYYGYKFPIAAPTAPVENELSERDMEFVRAVALARASTFASLFAERLALLPNSKL